MKPLNHAKTKIKKFLKKEIKIKKLDVPSKNELYLVDNKYLLKVFKFKKSLLISCKEYLKTYDREARSLELFSKFKEIPSVFLKYRGKKFAWIFREYTKWGRLKEIRNHKLHKKIIDLMLKMHSVKIKIDNKETKDFYERKIIQVRKRMKTYLPEKHQSKELYRILKNVKKLLPLILKNSKSMLHGDFVDRNILVKESKIKLIDFENSRPGPGIEDLIFYIDDSRIDYKTKKRLINYYNKKSKIKYSKRLFNIVYLLYLYRGWSSLLRIKQNELGKYDDRIRKEIKEILELGKKLNLDR